jgi:DNA-binding response OmpR family regulator
VILDLMLPTWTDWSCAAASGLNSSGASAAVLMLTMVTDGPHRGPGARRRRLFAETTFEPRELLARIRDVAAGR